MVAVFFVPPTFQLRVKVEKQSTSKLASSAVTTVFASADAAGAAALLRRPFRRAAGASSFSAVFVSVLTSIVPGPASAASATTTAPVGVMWSIFSVSKSAFPSDSVCRADSSIDRETVIFPALLSGSSFSPLAALRKLMSKAIMPSKLRPLSFRAFSASAYAGSAGATALTDSSTGSENAFFGASTLTVTPSADALTLRNSGSSIYE